MLARKGVFSAHGRAAVMATVAAVALTAVEPSLALAGPAPSGEGLSAATATSGAAVLPRRPLLPGLSAPVLRSLRPRTAVPIMTIITAAPSTTAEVRIITAVAPIITADMGMGRACPITGAIPSRAGNRKFPDRINPPVTVAGGFLLAGAGR
jgi:hypothetical protein